MEDTRQSRTDNNYKQYRSILVLVMYSSNPGVGQGPVWRPSSQASPCWLWEGAGHP
jgi:hypothetical protein